MLDTIGLRSQEELVSYLPEDVLFRGKLAIEAGRSEYDIIDYFRRRGEESGAGYASFLGAGVYRHYRPCWSMPSFPAASSSRRTRLTKLRLRKARLPSIFEFQTMVCQLTGMDVANASMYDGSSAIPEAAMMAVRITGATSVLVARSVHPEYREVLDTSTRHQGMPVSDVRPTNEARPPRPR